MGQFIYSMAQQAFDGPNSVQLHLLSTRGRVVGAVLRLMSHLDKNYGVTKK